MSLCFVLIVLVIICLVFVIVVVSGFLIKICVLVFMVV